MSDNLPAKSFWQRPEGTTGKLVLAGGTALAAGGAFYVAPLIIAGLTNIIVAGSLGAVVVVIVAMLSNKKFRTALGYLFQSTMRRITGWFKDIDPMNIMRGYIDKLKEKVAMLEEQIANLSGHVNNLTRVITQNMEDIQKNNVISQKAHQQNDNRNATLYRRRSQRLTKSNEKLISLRGRMEKVLTVLKKMLDNSEFLVDDLKDEIRVIELEQNSLGAAASGFKTALAIIKGDDHKDLYDQTVQKMADEYGMVIGQLDQAMETSERYLKNLDLESGYDDIDQFNMFERMQTSDNTKALTTVKLNGLMS